MILHAERGDDETSPTDRTEKDWNAELDGVFGQLQTQVQDGSDLAEIVRIARDRVQNPTKTGMAPSDFAHMIVKAIDELDTSDAVRQEGERLRGILRRWEES